MKLACSCLYKRFSREDKLSKGRDTFLQAECPTNIGRGGKHEPSTVISVPLLPVHKWFFYHELILQWCPAQVLWRNKKPQNTALQNVEKMKLFLSSPCEIFWTEMRKKVTKLCQALNYAEFTLFTFSKINKVVVWASVIWEPQEKETEIDDLNIIIQHVYLLIKMIIKQDLCLLWECYYCWVYNFNHYNHIWFIHR